MIVYRDSSWMTLGSIILGPLIYVSGIFLLASSKGLMELPVYLVGCRPWESPFGAFFYLQTIYFICTLRKSIHEKINEKWKIVVNYSSLGLSILGNIICLGATVSTLDTYKEFGASAQALLSSWLLINLVTTLVQSISCLVLVCLLIVSFMAGKKQ
jgi:hypothetical protein